MVKLEVYEMAEKKAMNIKILSFGYKYGTPENANYLYDVRFLPNPYWVEELRPKTGRDREVSDFVIGSDAGAGFFNQLRPLLLYIVQQNIIAGKDELLLAIGCTGGRHRSVAVAEVICDLLNTTSAQVTCEHRDIDRDE